MKAIDPVWETYWQFIAANLALTMTAATAFRTFFISRAQARRPLSRLSNDTWYSKSKELIRSAFHPRTWRSKPRANMSVSGDANVSAGPARLEHRVPRGTMTGIRTLISGQGRSESRPLQAMHSVVEEEYGDSWPLQDLSTAEEGVRAITVQRDVTVVSEVC